jgi:hypothetical protein
MPIDPASRTLLNWSDGVSSLGGSPLRPPKKVLLEERSAGAHSSTFEIFQVYDNLIRRTLGHIGGKTRRRIDALATAPAGDDLVRSVQPWNLPAATGLRLRAMYEFRNDFGVASPRLMAHRLGSVGIKEEATVGVITPPVLGVPVGIHGKGAIEVDVLFATDPTVQVQLVQPWNGAAGSIRDLVRDSFVELARLDPDLGVDPDDATPAFEELFSDFLPDEAPDGWVFGPPATVKGDEGQVVPFSLQIEAPTPGRSLFAVQIEELAEQPMIACSEIVALEVTEQLDLLLLMGPEVGAQPIGLTYLRGSLDAEELQAELDRMWRSLAEDPELADAVRASGIDVSEMPGDRSPFRVLEEAAGVEPGSILLIVGGTAARDLLREVFLPRIRERYGAGAVRREQREG